MEVTEAIRTRRSVRAYATRPIPAEVMTRMQEALRLAPSACNIQPWRFILVTDPDVRQKLALAANGQKWMADAPAIIVGCGFPDQAYQRMGGHGNSVDIDVAIALDHLSLAAVADGLATCWIGRIQRDAGEDAAEHPERRQGGRHDAARLPGLARPEPPGRSRPPQSDVRDLQHRPIRQFGRPSRLTEWHFAFGLFLVFQAEPGEPSVAGRPLAARAAG